MRLPGPINVRLSVITAINRLCYVGRGCHTRDLGVTFGPFNPYSAFSFTVSRVAELGLGKTSRADSGSGAPRPVIPAG